MGDWKTLYYLLGVKSPVGNKYMILESDKDCSTKSVHVIDFSVKQFYNVGRRVTNDVCVSDITVSRNQAIISMKYGEVLLEDSNSKFGTFLLINGAYKLANNAVIHVERKVFFVEI